MLLIDMDWCSAKAMLNSWTWRKNPKGFIELWIVLCYKRERKKGVDIRGGHRVGNLGSLCLLSISASEGRKRVMQLGNQDKKGGLSHGKCPMGSPFIQIKFQDSSVSFLHTNLRGCEFLCTQCHERDVERSLHTPQRFPICRQSWAKLTCDLNTSWCSFPGTAASGKPREGRHISQGKMHLLCVSKSSCFVPDSRQSSLVDEQPFIPSDTSTQLLQIRVAGQSLCCQPGLIHPEMDAFPLGILQHCSEILSLGKDKSPGSLPLFPNYRVN